MKKIIIVLSLLMFSCKSDDVMNNSNCDLVAVNTSFDQILGYMSYTDIENLLGIPGNHFRTNDLGPSGEMKFYRWDFCDGSNSFECWLINDERVHLKSKDFANNSCSNNVNQSNYSVISVGDSYSQVTSLLGNQNDNIRVDYDAQGVANVKIYRWYNCTDNTVFIEVWFDFNGNVFLINNSF